MVTTVNQNMIAPLGVFSGSVIPDGSDIKQAFQSLETPVIASKSITDIFTQSETDLQSSLPINYPGEFTCAASPAGIAAGFTRCITTGEVLYIPEGVFTITSVISLPQLQRNLKVVLHPQTRLVASSSLNDAILKILDCNGYVVQIDLNGANIDGSSQEDADEGSGESWGLIHLQKYSYGSYIKNGRFNANVGNDELFSDSAIFCQGYGLLISGNTFIGFSDSAIYSSGNSSGLDGYATRVINNVFIDNQVGFIDKRLGEQSIVSGNIFRQCRVGVSTGSAAGTGGMIQPGKRITITDNRFDDCARPIYLVWADGGLVANNYIRGWGYTDGVGTSDAAALTMMGCNGVTVSALHILNTRNDTTLHGILLQQATVEGLTRSCVSNNISAVVDGGAGTNRAYYEQTGSDSNIVNLTLRGTFITPTVVVGSSTRISGTNPDGTMFTRFGSLNRIELGGTDTYLRFPTGGGLYILRPGVDAQGQYTFSNSGGNQVRFISSVTDSKPTIVNTRTDTGAASTGGVLSYEIQIQGMTKIKTDEVGVGFNGSTPVGKTTLNGAATDLATTQALVNQLRTMLINLGLAT